MKQFWILSLVILLLFLALFLIFESMELSFFTDLANLMNRGDLWVALIGISLLTVDVLLPIPSSLVMVTHGALFGLVLGTLISLLGSLCAAAVGYLVGRYFGATFTRWLPGEGEQAYRLLREWGWLAIALTRPVPLLAETTVVMAGVTRMGWTTLFSASLVGSFPMSLLYAFTGATATRLDNIALAFALVIGVTGFFWLVGKWFSHYLPRSFSRSFRETGNE
jgi:uncharacterized membrane protein YdjX (TVP38/TMEM64 family)